jgi:hypothetical protein
MSLFAVPSDRGNSVGSASTLNSLLCEVSSRRRDDDYALLENGVVVGRIFKVPVAPQDRPWMWASGHKGEIKRAAHGYEPTREAATL